ncbi:hypothetical protein JG688_00016826 [Phytophthora aleatoria]|uniref:Uncharacterized protein n=2 Tax=Phytophthora TaxID=4783 RepID=A0A8J5ITI2_9STRA|nr:hypothetical protein JG688_00016826 [Phytophthora aleatoria]
MASDGAAAMVTVLIGDSSERGSRHPAPASALLSSRIAELEELQHKLHGMEKHLVALVEIHQDIAARHARSSENGNGWERASGDCKRLVFSGTKCCA